MKQYRQLRTLRALYLSLAAASIACLWPSTSQAVGTRHFVIESGADFEKGELVGVAVDSAGYLHAGLDLGSIEVLDAESVWTSLEKDGTVFLGTGNSGKLFQVKAGKAEEVAVVENALAITSIAFAFGKTIVGAIPGGKLYELKGKKLEEFTELKDAQHVWGMSFDEAAGALYVATGPEGKLFRVTADGTAQVYYDAPQAHLMSVAAGDGKVFAGSSGEARLYQVTGPGRATVLYDFATTEVRAIALSASGEVYAIANELAEGPRADKISTVKPKSPSRPSAKGGKGTLFHFDKDGKPEELYSSKKEHFVSLSIDENGRPIVGTGSEGKVIRMEPNHNHSVIADVEERQVMSVLGAKKGGWVIASDPVVAHPIEGMGGPDAVWTSEVQDAGLRAKFGRISWDATGDVEFSTRSGNTAKPDETWTNWSAPLKRRSLVSSDPGRYLQVRARLSGKDTSRVWRVSVPFVTDNLRPVITNVSVKSDALVSGSSGLSASGGPLEGKASSKLKLSWEVENPDEDPLRYRVDFRRQGDNQWFDALPPGEVLTDKNWVWETEDLPEGEYRVRVKASDEPSNPPQRALSHEFESEIILVDNTAPEISGLVVQGRRLSGKASDGVGPVRRIEMRVAGDSQWLPIDPKDGIFDQAEELFEIDLSSLVPLQGALLTVRVFDTAGNSHVEHVQVPQAR